MWYCEITCEIHVIAEGMVFRAGLRDPCLKDVARLSESARILTD